jgi:hypothetical protein
MKMIPGFGAEMSLYRGENRYYGYYGFHCEGSSGSVGHLVPSLARAVRAPSGAFIDIGSVICRLFPELCGGGGGGDNCNKCPPCNCCGPCSKTGPQQCECFPSIAGLEDQLVRLL